MSLSKNIIYYTDNRLPEHIMSAVQKTIEMAGLPIVCVSLKPLDFGDIRIVSELQPSVITMFRQILSGLSASDGDIVFFAEHDVLYNISHWDFVPLRDDTYYYNTNVWRWDYPRNRFITYDSLRSLSGICAYRKLLLNHYKKRIAHIEAMGFEDGRDPNWARKMGYEPGKAVRRGGFMDEQVEEWKSPFPNIDIRHKRTITPPKVTLDSFRHQPDGWLETTMSEIEGWNFGTLFP